MKYFLKQGIFPFIYQLFMAMIAFGILAINGLVWLKVLLAALNVAFYLFIVASVAYKDGQQALKVRMANDLERREIIRTGEDRPLKLNEEYKPWKGFASGLISCFPILLFLILHTIVYNATGNYTGLGAIAGIIGFMFFVFFRINASDAAAEAEVVPWYAYYGVLIAVPIIMLTMGVAYMMGAKKIMRQQEIIKEKQRQIYGDNV